MRNHIEAATRCGMPAVGISRAAATYVSADKTRMGAVAFSPLAVDATNGAQGASTAWSPPV